MFRVPIVRNFSRPLLRDSTTFSRSINSQIPHVPNQGPKDIGKLFTVISKDKGLRPLHVLLAAGLGYLAWTSMSIVRRNLGIRSDSREWSTGEKPSEVYNKYLSETEPTTDTYSSRLHDITNQLKSMKSQLQSKLPSKSEIESSISNTADRISHSDPIKTISEMETHAMTEPLNEEHTQELLAATP